MSTEKEKSEVHHYDGIEEQDNPIPGWFNALFYGGILLAVLYFSYFELWGGPSLKAEYASDVEVHERLLSEQEKKSPRMGEAELLVLAKDSKTLNSARLIFTQRCSACHGASGQGGIGPNLTDAYWIHGGKISQIRDTITTGVLDKGMPPWGPILTDNEINSLAGYVYSLLGTKPAGAKAPQGTLESN